MIDPIPTGDPSTTINLPPKDRFVMPLHLTKINGLTRVVNRFPGTNPSDYILEQLRHPPEGYDIYDLAAIFEEMYKLQVALGTIAGEENPSVSYNSILVATLSNAIVVGALAKDFKEARTKAEKEEWNSIAEEVLAHFDSQCQWITEWTMGTAMIVSARNFDQPIPVDELFISKKSTVTDHDINADSIQSREVSIKESDDIQIRHLAVQIVDTVLPYLFVTKSIAALNKLLYGEGLQNLNSFLRLGSNYAYLYDEKGNGRDTFHAANTIHLRDKILKKIPELKKYLEELEANKKTHIAD